MSISSLYQSVRKFIAKYERALLPGALLFGLVSDFLTVAFLNLTVVLTILAVHMFLAGIWILVLNSTHSFFSLKPLRFLKLFAPVLLYYSFGAMLSTFLVLYTNSGSVVSGAPFLLLIAFIMIAIELFREKLKNVFVQVFIYSIAVFSYITLALPFVLGRMGDRIFIAGALIVLAYLILYQLILSRVSVPFRVGVSRFSFTFTVSWFVIVLFYFLNIIPPFPLSLKESGVYHSVVREGSVYKVVDTKRGFVDSLLPIRQVTLKRGQAHLSLYTAFFSPIPLSSTVVHSWKKYERGRFVEKSSIAYPVVSGRLGGYRGYTETGRISPGLWWVTVETQEGKVVGGLFFYARETDDPLVLEEKIR